MLDTDTRVAAETNWKRNQGSSAEWFIHSGNYSEPPKQPKIRPESRGIVSRNQVHQSTAALAGFTDRIEAEPSNPDEAECMAQQKRRKELFERQPRSRLRTSEAEKNAMNAKLQKDRWSDFAGNLNYRPPVRVSRLGAGVDKQEIMKKAIGEQDWFTHSITRTLSEFTNQRKASHYNLRNNENAWFCHRTARDVPQLQNSNQPRRVRQDGVDIAQKSKGTADILSMQPPPLKINQRSYNCPSAEAQFNHNIQVRGIGMSACLDSTKFADYTDHSRPSTAKIRGHEAEEWRKRGLGTIQLGTSDSRRAETSHIPNRSRPESAMIREKGIHGTGLSRCLNINQAVANDGDQPDDHTLTHPRVRSEEAERAMRRNRGQMDQYVGKFTESTTMHPKRRTQPRAIRGCEGQECASKNQGSGAKELLTNYQLDPDLLRKAYAKFSPDVSQTAELNKNGLVGNLLGSLNGNIENVPLAGVEAPVRRRLYYEGVGNAARNNGGEMSAILDMNL